MKRRASALGFPESEAAFRAEDSVMEIAVIFDVLGLLRQVVDFADDGGRARGQALHLLDLV